MEHNGSLRKNLSEKPFLKNGRVIDVNCSDNFSSGELIAKTTVDDKHVIETVTVSPREESVQRFARDVRDSSLVPKNWERLMDRSGRTSRRSAFGFLADAVIKVWNGNVEMRNVETQR
jgi:hypothetical protein